MASSKRIWKTPPKNIDEYKRWLKDTHKLQLNQAEQYYETSVTKLKEDIYNSNAWKAIIHKMRDLDEEYETKTGLKLLKNINEIELKMKPFSSVLSKSFRKDFLIKNNSGWPEPPREGWTFPDNCFSKLGDLVRTLFVVRYLDGVSFLAERLESILDDHECDFEMDFESRFEGHYAVHLAITHNLPVFHLDKSIKEIDFTMEIQIVTQSQEAIRELLHPYYEKRRMRSDESDSQPWQWNYNDDEFNTNYLGHVIQYVDGVIAQILDRQEIRKNGS